MINNDVILGDAETYYRKLVRKTEEYQQLEEKHKKLVADYKTLLHENESLIDECNTCKYKYHKKALEKIEEYCSHYLMHNPKSSAIDLNEIMTIINEVKE